MPTLDKSHILRKCKKCKKKLPLDRKHFKLSRKAGSQGFTYVCRECQPGKAPNENGYHRPTNPKTRKCIVCGKRKDLNFKNFRDLGNSKNKITGPARYSKECKECPPQNKFNHDPKFVPKKKCQHCGTELPATFSNFRATGTKRTILTDTCKKCPPKKIISANNSKTRALAEQFPERVQQPETPQREFAARMLARRRLIYFIKRFQPDYQAGWVHYDICRRLEEFVKAVERGEHPRLMLFVPPRHGKSNIVSEKFIAWAMGHHPEWENVISGYNADLPEGFSRNIREIVLSPEYRALFPDTVIAKDSRAVSKWNTTRKGQLLAVGRGGGLTGKGFHMGVIDDPIKDAEEADSETIRNSLWDWYSSTFYTRQHPGGGILVILTRWHDDDLAGRLIEQMEQLRKDGAPEEQIDNWEIIEYPAIAEHDEYINADGSITPVPTTPKAMHVRSQGEALHPERYSLAYLQKVKAQIQSRHWSALYQQNPVPDEGAYFRKSYFRYGHLMSHKYLSVAIAADLAIGEKQANDWTVFAVGGLDWNDQIHIIDIVRFKGDTEKIINTAIALAKKYKPQLFGLEHGQIEMSIMPILRKAIKKEQKANRKFHITFADGDKALKPNKDKQARARPLQGRMQQGMIYFPDTEAWFEDLFKEFIRFPAGKNDDQVDAMAWLIELLLGMQPPKRPKSKRRKSWKDKLGDSLTGKNLGHMAA